jgi:tetratricopeptide (TPR) repeat protein
VRKSGNKVRITTQLINASDGYHLWSETYDRTLDDIFVVQDDIAGEVVKALQISLLKTGLATDSKTQDPEAYNLVLKARHHRSQDNMQAGLERSINYFRQSLQRDPTYAVAWAGLSDAYAKQGENGFVPIAEGYRRARDAAEKALSLDERLVDGHLVMGNIHSTYDWDWAAADASYRRALELDPGSAITLQASTLPAVIFGRWDEAMELANKAIVRDPLDPHPYMSLGVIYEAVNRDKEAELAFRKALELAPGAYSFHLRLGRSLLLQGKAEAALREVQQDKDEIWQLTLLPLVLNALGRRSESVTAFASLKSKYGGEMAYQIAEVHAFRGEADLAFEWLERAYDQRDPGVVNIKGDRMFYKFVNDPRYKAFLKKLKLPG